MITRSSLIALLIMVSGQVALAAPMSTNIAAVTLQKSSPISNANTASARAILNLVETLPNSSSCPATIKVPNNAFLALIRELQSHNVRVLPTGAPAPTSAKSMFKLQAEDGAFELIMYLE